MASPSPAAAEAGPRDPRLDGLRGIAILLVLLYHATWFWLARSPLDVALVLVPAVGLYGVDLFFVLSGFLITGILLRTRGSEGYFRTFYARRTLRIFPAYYATLILFLVVFPLLTPQAESFWKEGASRETFWYWTYLSNFHVAWTGRFHHYFLGVTWSLAIEEQFYLLWPLVVWLAGRKRLEGICWGVIAAALALRCALVWGGVNALAPLTLLPCRMDTLATGALIALAVLEPAKLARLARAARWLLPPAALALLAFVVGHAVAGPEAGAGAQTGLVQGEPALLFYTSDPWMLTLGYTGLCLLFGSLLVRVITLPRDAALPRVLVWAPLVSIGKYSYAIYLLHRLGIEIARNFVDPTRMPGGFLVGQVTFWAACLGVSYLLALASWHLVEVHFLRLKRFFPYRLRMPPQTQAPAPPV